MRRVLGFVFLVVFSGGAACQEDIVDVLRRSQEQRLQAQQPAPADDPGVATVQRSFSTLLQTLQPAPVVELRVVIGPVVAETLHGHIIVANRNLAEMPESVRLFILAHELGHVVQRHWLQTALLYRKWVPGEVTAERTDPVADQLGREASVLAHEHEFAADAFAAQVLHTLGRDGDGQLEAVFHQFGMTQDSATHPGTRKRMAALRDFASSTH